jgi:hypothetical protein
MLTRQVFLDIKEGRKSKTKEQQKSQATVKIAICQYCNNQGDLLKEVTISNPATPKLIYPLTPV